MRYIFIIILAFFSAFAYSQNDCTNYFRELSIAKYENFKHQTNNAISRYEKAKGDFPECTCSSSQFSFIKMYLKLNDTSNAYKLIIEEIKHGYKLENINYIGIYKSSLGSYYDSLKLQEDSLHKIFYSNLDHNLFSFIHEMISLDRNISRVPNVNDSVKKYIRHQIFRKNIESLADYVDEHGAIGYKQLGIFNSMISVILLHHRLDNQNDKINVDRLIQKYLISIKNGDVSPEVMINLYDNMANIIDNNVPQSFGKFYNSKTKEFFPIKNIKKIDSLRLSIGLNTLKEYAEMRNITLPVDYEEK